VPRNRVISTDGFNWNLSQNRLNRITKQAEEVLWVILPPDEDATLPLNPREEALDHPPPCVSPQPASILCGRFAAIGSVRRDHLDAVSTQFHIQRIAVVGAISDQIFGLGFDHVKIEA
jgi:hypothetical protein